MNAKKLLEDHSSAVKKDDRILTPIEPKRIQRFRNGRGGAYIVVTPNADANPDDTEVRVVSVPDIIRV